MSLITKLLNQNVKEDLYFEKYENVNNVFSKYRNYLNFSKKTEKIEIEDIENINKDKAIQINISNKLYDLIDNMYLYIKFDNIDREYTVNELIDYIELYQEMKEYLKSLEIVHSFKKKEDYLNRLNLFKSH